MKLREYQDKAAALNKAWTRTHLHCGLAAEAGEVAGLLQKSEYKGKPVDRARVLDELGDVFWYAFCLVDFYSLDIEEVLEKNIEKLEGRHGKRSSK